MSFDWSEYLGLAQELAGQTVSPASQEAKLRAAISRAYYAAFCKARNHLRDHEGHAIPRGGGAHKYVRDQFKNNPDRLRSQIGHNLDRLRRHRNMVDYDDTVPGLLPMTSRDLKLSQRALSALAAL
jgi:uncharacterized protein (UPF0332 family)